MSYPLPDYLHSTASMLAHAYPNGVPPSDYEAVVALLLERLSLRNAAAVVRWLCEGLDEAYEDVSRVAGGDVNVCVDARERVERAIGTDVLKAWRSEAD